MVMIAYALITFDGMIRLDSYDYVSSQVMQWRLQYHYRYHYLHFRSTHLRLLFRLVHMNAYLRNKIVHRWSWPLVIVVNMGNYTEQSAENYP